MAKSLMEVRTGFVESISGPVLKSLLDRLLEEKVITDAEREAAEAEPNRSDRARSVIDTVRRKGKEARSKMIGFLMDDDPFLCDHLGINTGL
uniref:CARD domain-containing protein n=1 Tax=Gasterosteus aculeatus aculeatus TaxID=481459 RepID=A0AAQ4PJ52_GASAC